MCGFINIRCWFMGGGLTLLPCLINYCWLMLDCWFLEKKAILINYCWPMLDCWFLEKKQFLVNNAG